MVTSGETDCMMFACNSVCCGSAVSESPPNQPSLAPRANAVHVELPSAGSTAACLTSHLQSCKTPHCHPVKQQSCMWYKGCNLLEDRAAKGPPDVVYRAFGDSLWPEFPGREGLLLWAGGAIAGILRGTGVIPDALQAQLVVPHDLHQELCVREPVQSLRSVSQSLSQSLSQEWLSFLMTF